MRRPILSLTLLFWLLPTMLISLSQRQPASGQDNSAPLIPLMATETAATPVTLTPLDSPPADLRALSGIGADSCQGAVALPYQFDVNEVTGDQTGVFNFSITASDPDISACFARPGGNSTGYRSVWYRFDNFITPINSLVPIAGSGVNGRLVVRTMPNIDYRWNYDTVVVIYAANDCTNLARLACNDDANALLSEVSVPIVAGQRYYIQVVSFRPGGTPQMSLNLEAKVMPDSVWTEQTPLPQPITRHSVVMVGNQAYIIGRQNSTTGQRVSNTLRYDTSTGQVTQLAEHPAGETAASAGYSNHAAALVGSKIHLPAGDVGGEMVGTHWVYDIPSNTWQVYSAANGQVNPPWGPPPGANVPDYAQMGPYVQGNQQGFYFAGGLTGAFLTTNATQVSNRVFRYVEPTTGAAFWQTLPTMLRGRYAHTAVTLPDGRFCVVGGLTVNETIPTNPIPALVPDGECFSPNGGSWQLNVGVLNVPRYMAGSALGPDGRWYVFGGYDASSIPVPQIEVFDPATGVWQVLAQNYRVNAPPRGWVRGGFVGDALWLFGGEQGLNGPVVSQVQAKNFVFAPALTGAYRAYLPFVTGVLDAAGGLNTAVPLIPGQTIQHSFTQAPDVYHSYFFDVDRERTVQLTLGNIPFGSNYDFLLYNQNKGLLDSGQNLGANPEQLLRRLSPGRYYLLVVRDAPPPAVQPDTTPYHLTLNFLD